MCVPEEEGDSLIIYFLGGGFVSGSMESYDSVLRRMGRHSGSKVISVDYRLAPEHKFPTAVEDAPDAYRWVLADTSELGVSPGKIALSGDSAGGNLCASISIICRDNENAFPKVQVFLYPVDAPDVASIPITNSQTGSSLQERWATGSGGIT